MMYKISHHMVPSYLTELLPLRQGRHHQTRNEETYTPVRSRTERHKKSLMPSMVRRWNALDQNIRTLPTISRFKRALQQSMFPTRQEQLSRVKGRASIADIIGYVCEPRICHISGGHCFTFSCVTYSTNW